MTCCGGNQPNEELSKTFKPNYRIKPLTPKFYARHDTDVNLIQLENVPIYEREINKRLKYDPRYWQSVPITTNQVYGWLNDLAMVYTDKIDAPIFRRNRRTTDEMRALAQILSAPNKR